MKNKNNAGIIHLFSLFLVGIIVVVIGGILWTSQKSGKPIINSTQPSPNPEITSKTYTSSNYEIKFEYPSTLEIQDEGNLFIGVGKENSSGAFDTHVFINVSDLPGARLSSEEYVDHGYQVEESEVTIDDKKASRKIVTMQNQNAVPKLKDITYLNEVSLPSSDGYLTEIYIEDEKYLDILNQILSTFEFTEPINTESEENQFAYYTSEEFGYSVSYPLKQLRRYVCPEPENRGFYLTAYSINWDDDIADATVIDFPSGYGSPLYPETCWIIDAPEGGNRHIIEIEVFDTIPKRDLSKYTYEENSLTVDNTEATELIAAKLPNVNAPFDWYKQVIVSKNGKFYEFFLKYKYFESAFDQIVKSFEFTD